jgi:hypothetical protein
MDAGHAVSMLALVGSTAGCASRDNVTPGARPLDMSAARHEAIAHEGERLAQEHEAKHDPGAAKATTVCNGDPFVQTDICWTIVNPTEEHRKLAEKLGKHAAWRP